MANSSSGQLWVRLHLGFGRRSQDCILREPDYSPSLARHLDTVTAVAVTLDGQQLISASTDNTVKIWELETGEVFATFTCDSAPYSCAFWDALKLIVAGDAGGRVHFLQSKTRSLT